MQIKLMLDKVAPIKISRKKKIKKRNKTIEDFCLSAVYISCAVTIRIYWVV